MKTNKLTIKLLGHEATVDIWDAHLADGVFRKEDGITVWFGFSAGDAPGGTLGFGIDIPAKEYDKEEFVRLVQREGEKALREIQEQSEKQRVKAENEGQRRASLDALTSRLKSRVFEGVSEC